MGACAAASTDIATTAIATIAIATIATAAIAAVIEERQPSSAATPREQAEADAARRSP